jgi:hypothetical protein
MAQCWNIKTDIDELARLYAMATGHNEQLVLGVLHDGVKSPRSIFLYLQELVEKGSVKDDDFERALREFYSKYC